MMPLTTALEWLDLIEHELLLFAAFWFAIGAIDEFGVDLLWVWLRLSGRVGTGRAPDDHEAPLRGVAAVLVPAWHEAGVVGAMLAHCLRVWPQQELRIYAGCYRNDPHTLAAMIGAAGDARLRIVVHDRSGPTTKADCLNRLYAAMVEDEKRGGFIVRSVILHDAEDMVHPAALAALDRGLDDADFVQVPVRPEPQAASPWIAGHYCDEFAESHGKGMVVRDWLGVGLPAAGVGCAFRRDAIEAIAARRGSHEPFAAECLTEDYEFGLLIEESGRRARFLRLRDGEGRLVATREFFPSGLYTSVRQKTRWLHGIAYQGWERLGWSGRPLELWMRLRDRRGPLTAIVLAAGYMLIVLAPISALAVWLGLAAPPPVDPVLRALVLFNFAALLWRVAARVLFTAREYGAVEGLRAIVRMPLANVIAIMAGRRALFAYLASLRSGRVKWDHTLHFGHPSLAGAH
ncbi:glycosyl transferase family protein [Novosphingobium sp. KCTC 2891]|uniref:glycosyl transferase family protein n=1 Tax=Novosphingobium sp. KCTC 2891 TaxID=2989730 RepID=UPI002222B278|nr:glycosyl transferase family protein [Novosphingobium sp. KCTC 2891]MCW1384036.1 glycosyl transferase family protein [Novosphingobium sp. KCTC 2891]